MARPNLIIPLHARLDAPLIAAAKFEITDDWLAVAYVFGAVTVLSIAGSFNLGFLAKRIG